MELAELHVLVAALDGAIARLAEGLANDGSPSSGDGGVVGGDEGVPRRILTGKGDSSEVGTADFFFLSLVCRITLTPCCERGVCEGDGPLSRLR